MRIVNPIKTVRNTPRNKTARRMTANRATIMEEYCR